ncbi:VCBS domain-containing protein, partial [Thalassospira sp. TSL5-1]|uniref:beta strand repeat-containing protein n=1 Tax=Thalassospira sp. TSL5-1 TaxID=1544451 RepID=UPI000962EBD3
EDTDYKLKVTDFNYSQPGGEKDTFKAVRIDTLPDSGTLKLNGTAVTKGQVVSVADITDGKLVYSPAENVNGDAVTTFTFSVQDSRDGFDITPKTVTVNVTPQNDAPSFNDSKAVVTSVNESTDANKGVPATAIITDANIGDIDLSTTGGLDSGTFGEGKITVAITGADSSEQLTIDTDALTGKALPSGVVVSGGVNGADLVITLDGNTTRAEVNQILNAIRYSTNSDTFTGGERTITTTLSDGKVSSDDGNAQAGGNAGGPDALSAQLISKITVVEKNDPPLGADQTVTTLEDTDYKLKVTDFNYSQPGGEKDTFKAVRIDTLPDSGTLKLNGTAISAGTVVSVADITSGKLVYSPAENVNGDAVTTFTFSVQDSRDGFDTTPKTVTVNVTPQNDAPSFNDSKAVETSVNESTDANKGVPATAIITDANIGDIDLSTTGGLDSDTFGEGKITVAITGADSSEQLTIDTDALTGKALPSGVVVSGGVNGADLVITLDGNTTRTEVNQILNAIRYSTNSDTFTGGERTITTTLSDGKVSTDDGNVQAGGDAGGPDALSAQLISKITVVEKNDPPLGADQTVTTLEDTDYKLKVTDFNYSQPGGEKDTFKAVRIDTLPDSGTLKLNGTAISAGTVVSVADITSGKLVYSPAENVNGDAVTTFTFSVQDSRDGFDTTPKTVTVNVTPQNDAPSFNDSKAVTTSVNESTDANKGVPATAIITGANIGDIDLSTTGALSSTVYGEGTITVAITGADASEQLTIDSSALPAGVTQTGGVNGSNLVITLDANTTVAEVNAILDAIRYSTTSDTFTGGERTITTTLSDGKVSTNDGNVQAGGDAGGPNALSVDLVSKITVVEKNDPPVISGSPAVTATEDTDYAFKLGDFHYEQKGGESTVDTDLNKITVKSLPDSTKGKLLLQTGTSGGSPVYTEVAVGQDISAADITAGKLIYRADANLNGPEAKTSFTYSVWDKGHAASSNVPAESATGTMDISVTPVNDAPVLSGTSKSPAMVIKDDGTGTTGTAALASGVSVSDIDITTDADVSSYGGGTIIVSFTEGYQSGDRLSVNGGMLAGMAGVTGGNGSALVISLTNDATSAQVKSIIEAIRYGSVDADPTANKTDTTRAYSIVLNDGDNNADGGAIDGVKDAGGPTSLNSAALTGTITFRYPPTATDDTVTVSKDSTTGTGNVKTNDSDPEHTADPTHEADFTVTEVNSATGNVGKTITGTYGTITINADGTYSYKLDPTNTAVIQQLPGDAPLTESFTYQITDNDGQTDTATLHIKILGHNEPPEATDNSNSVKVGNNETATGNVISDNDGHGVDSNTENTSQTLSVVGINGATGNIGTPVTITYGTITVNSDGTYRYVLNTGNSAVRNLPVGQTLTETFTYTLSDGIDTDVATVTITIDGPNASKPPSPPPTPGTGPGPGDPPGSPDPGPGGTPGPGNDPFTRVENSFGSKVDFRSPLNNPVRLTLELQDRVATASGIQLFPVPATAFQHTDPTETLDIEASQPDGSPLPSYVNFNAQNLVFVVDGDAARVAGAKSIDIRVTGRDTRGNEATTTFTILFTDRNIDGQDGKAGENAPDKQDGEKDQGNPDNVNPDNGNPDNGNAPDTGEAPATSGNDRAEAPISDRDALAGMAAKERMLSRIAVDAQAMNFGRHAILAEREALLADFAALFRG